MASMEIFDKAGMPAIRKKGDLLTGFLEHCLRQIPQDKVQIMTPRNIKERGSQLSLKMGRKARNLVKRLKDSGIICDFREPDIIRAAPAPLYNTFFDVYRFANVIAEECKG
jgi:kynureninase